MSSVRIDVGIGHTATAYYLTTDHQDVKDGVPVLTDAFGRSFGPWEIPFRNPEGMTARAIARFALRDNPGDDEVVDLVTRFESRATPRSFLDSAATGAAPQAAAASSPCGGEQVSLYDYYAGQALVGLLTRSEVGRYGGTHDLIARQAGELADAMLAARASQMKSHGLPPHQPDTVGDGIPERC